MRFEMMLRKLKKFLRLRNSRQIISAYYNALAIAEKTNRKH